MAGYSRGNGCSLLESPLPLFVAMQYGDTTHTFVERTNYKGVGKPPPPLHCNRLF